VSRFWRGDGRLVGLFSLLVFATLGLGVLVRQTLEGTIRGQLEAVITATLRTTSVAVESHLDELLRAASTLNQDPELRDAADSCAATHTGCGQVTSVLGALVRGGRHAWGGFVAHDGRLVAQAGGRRRDPSPEELQRALRASSGERARLLEAELAPDGGAVLPLVVALGKGGGVLWLDARLAPMERVVRAARTGHSGETYLFDRSGRLLSESRFIAQLHEAGLLSRSQPSAVLTLVLRDPITGAGTDPAQRPLTRSVASAVAGQSGVDLHGYPDYRGVPVVGTWQWLSRYGLGIVTELDVADAYQSLRRINRLFTGVLGLLALALLAAMAAALRARRARARAAQAERRAERFGQYELEQKLGEGGMGVVYLARHALLRRKAAIKLLRPDQVSEEALRRFEIEAQITSTLSHPNTVDIYDYGRSTGGEFYYVMEYLEGLDLQRLVQHFGPLPQARVVHFLRQLCDSLAEAHALGVVHRDVKPANLFACTRGGVADTLKVLDFGIVQVGRAGADGVGTAAYMAPELFESASSVTPRSDLYAVGVVAQFLLTGNTPFGSDATREIVQAQLTRPPRPIALPDDEALDPALAAAVRACLALQPAARPASARSLRTLLDGSAMSGRWTSADAAAWWERHRAALRALGGGEPLSSRQSVVLSIGSSRPGPPDPPHSAGS